MSTERTAAFYELHQEWPADVKREVARHLLAAMGPAPRRCLFLGCATGANDALPLGRLADPRDEILAGDIEPACLERLRDVADKEGLRNIEARRIDVREDLAHLRTFDMVTLFFVIHRLDDWRPVVPRLAALVKPGGSLYLSEFAGPSGVIYLSNERGGRQADPVSRMVRRYFELLREEFAPPLKSTFILPAREALSATMSFLGSRDFSWPQRLTVEEMYRKIEARAYAPYRRTSPSEALLSRLRTEFVREWSQEVRLEETIRIYRFGP